MLPGIRFLFAAIVLSMSILVFGLGAAALLRAAHEEFANLPSRRVSPEPQFTRQVEPTATPTLALLRFDPPIAEKAPDEATAAIDTDVAIPDVAASEAAAPVAPDPVEPEKLAALGSEMTAPAEPAEPEIPAAETSAVVRVAPTEADALVWTDDGVKVAAVAEATEPSITVALAAAEPLADVPWPASSPAATRIATLGGPAVTVNEETSVKASQAKPARSAIRKRLSQRAKERRRIARRARLAREAALATQLQQANPFGQAPIVRRTQ